MSGGKEKETQTLKYKIGVIPSQHDRALTVSPERTRKWVQRADMAFVTIFTCVCVCVLIYDLVFSSPCAKGVYWFLHKWSVQVICVCVSVCCFLCMWVSSSPFITAIPLFFLLHCWAVFGFLGHFSSTVWASVIYVSASRRGHSAPCRREEHFATWGCYWASKQLLSAG